MVAQLEAQTIVKSSRKYGIPGSRNQIKRNLLCSQGHMPKVQLLQKYDLMQFAEVASAVR